MTLRLEADEPDPDASVISLAPPTLVADDLIDIDTGSGLSVTVKAE